MTTITESYSVAAKKAAAASEICRHFEEQGLLMAMTLAREVQEECGTRPMDVRIMGIRQDKPDEHLTASFMLTEQRRFFTGLQRDVVRVDVISQEGPYVASDPKPIEASLHPLGMLKVDLGSCHVSENAGPPEKQLVEGLRVLIGKGIQSRGIGLPKPKRASEPVVA